MKYLGAYSIPGTVIRLIPKRTDDLENRLYYEFLDFIRFHPTVMCGSARKEDITNF